MSIMDRLAGLRRFIFFSADAESARITAPEGLIFRPLDGRDFQRGALFREKGRADRFARRLAEGHRCWGFVDANGEASFYLWLSGAGLDATQAPITLGMTLETQDAWYVWDCRTCAERQRRGLYRMALLNARAMARAGGVATAAIACEARNVPSIRGILAAGFHEDARIDFVKLGGWRLLRRPGEAPRSPGRRAIPLRDLLRRAE